MSDDDEETPGFGLGDLLSQVQDMQERLAHAQAEAAEMLVEGRAGGGAVTVQITGAMEFKSIKIDPEFFGKGDLTLLEDMLLAAIRGAMESVSELNRQAISESGFDDLAGGLGDLDAAFGGLLGAALPGVGEDGDGDEDEAHAEGDARDGD